MADSQRKLFTLSDNPLCGISTYKDILNLATGTCTRQIKKLVFDGTEEWQNYGQVPNTYRLSISNTQSIGNPAICSHFVNSPISEITSGKFTVGSTWIYVRYADVSDLADFKSYLQQQYTNGTPVTVWYVLATPTTETITVPSGLSGTEEGYLTQSGTPTPTNPIYPTANNVEVWLHSLRKLTTSTDTITTLPADIYADGTNATVGLVGNMQQSGTPTPQNPIQPSETGERTGNLFDYTKTDGIIANKYINQRGNMVTDNEYYLSYPIKVNVGGTYTWRFNSNEGTGHTAPTVGFYDSSDNLLSTAQHDLTIRYFSFEVPANCAYIRASVFTRSNAQKEAMLNTGSSPLPYEPYGYKLDIKSANTTTPVYLGEVESMRKIKKYEFTGLEGWITRTGTPENVFFCERQGVNFINNAAICSHYANQDSGSFDDLQDKHFIVKIASSGDKTYFGIRDSSYPSTNEGATQLRSYLAQQYANGTPVTVWYVLATPTTSIINEPIRKIGDYADTVSGITIPTITGKDRFDVQTTLKPSEVSLNYTGWHDATVKEWDSSEWQ